MFPALDSAIKIGYEAACTVLEAIRKLKDVEKIQISKNILSTNKQNRILKKKLIIYQAFPRIFTNMNADCVPGGTYAE